MHGLVSLISEDAVVCRSTVCSRQSKIGACAESSHLDLPPGGSWMSPGRGRGPQAMLLVYPSSRSEAESLAEQLAAQARVEERRSCMLHPSPVHACA